MQYEGVRRPEHQKPTSSQRGVRAENDELPVPAPGGLHSPRPVSVSTLPIKPPLFLLPSLSLPFHIPLTLNPSGLLAKACKGWMIDRIVGVKLGVNGYNIGRWQGSSLKLLPPFC